jgi:two-component system, NtrC family, sensor kinase
MAEQIRILFVDDEKNVLKSLERTFLDEDYEILTAGTGAEGLAVLQSIAPVQVVISDYRMPEMDGVEFLRKVRNQWPDTVRIVLSGYADTASIVSAINEGQIYKFIPKPWNDDELKVAIVNAIERYFLNKKNIELTEALQTKNEELERMNDSLERQVAEKTSNVMQHNEMLVKVQNINYSIPVGLIGIDPDGLIVQCNKMAEGLLRCNEPDLLGNSYHDKLPADLCAFVDGISDKESMSGSFIFQGMVIKVTVGFMDNCDQKGTILVLAADTFEMGKLQI